MKKCVRVSVLALLILSLLTSCQREDGVYSYDFYGFKYLKGKWKLLYITDGMSSWNAKTYLSDNYEIEFYKLDRMDELMNSNTEKKLRLISCHDYENVYPSGNTEFYSETSFHESFQIYMLNSPATGDTLYLDGMYPVKNNPDTPTIHTYGVYVREK